jgi:protein subunit release factor B
MEAVRKDVGQIDRIVSENVERAVRAKDKVIFELQARVKAEQEKAREAE